jgi:ParB family chromosome partitioning protein
VRETEKLAAQLSKSPSPAVTGRSRGASSPEIRELVGRLQRRLGTRVNVNHGRRGNGRLEIFYKNLDELDRILALIFKKG